MSVSVAVPTLNGAEALERTLAAVRAQAPAEIVVLDSESTDATRAVAERFGAHVHLIARAEFGHGRGRNRLMELATGDRVAFLTQDAVPAGDGWLAALLEPGEALTYGPYVAPAGAPASLRREYDEWFAREPRVYRLADLPDPPMPGWPTFVSSANMCLARRAWNAVPFRDVPYAEDQQLGLDLLRAGFAKAYVPAAAVVHGHEYAPGERLRRWFDEFRALHDVYGWTAPASPRVIAGTIRAEVRKDRAYGADTGDALRWHAARALAAALGTRADGLPRELRRRLSLDRRI